MTKRPVFLTLWQIRLPITALSSIAHRLSGVLMVLMMPLFMWGLYALKSGGPAWLAWQHFSHQPLGGLTIWLGLCAVWYHVVAGLRHLIMDVAHLHDLKFARRSAVWLWLLMLVGAVWMGVRLW